MNVNKAIVIGGVTREPDNRVTSGLVNVSSFSVATNRIWKDKLGEKHSTPDYHNIVAFGKLADDVAAYVKVGNMIYVEGRLQTRTWESDGKKMHKTEIIADVIRWVKDDKEGVSGEIISEEE